MAETQVVQAEVVPAALAPAVPEESIAARLLPELPEYMEIAFRNLKDDKDFSTRNLTSEEKASFCRTYVVKGSLEAACDAIDISYPTMYRHLDRDPDFAGALSLAKLSLGGKIQTKSVEMALTDKGTFDRGLQLRRFFPSVYRNNDAQVNVGIVVNARPWRKPAR